MIVTTTTSTATASTDTDTDTHINGIYDVYDPKTRKVIGCGRFDELLGLGDAEGLVDPVPPVPPVPGLPQMEPVEVCVWVCPVLQYQEMRNGSVEWECLLLRAIDGSGSGSGGGGDGEDGGERTFVRCGTVRISNRWFKGWKLEGITII